MKLNVQRCTATAGGSCLRNDPRLFPLQKQKQNWRVLKRTELHPLDNHHSRRCIFTRTVMTKDAGFLHHFLLHPTNRKIGGFTNRSFSSHSVAKERSISPKTSMTDFFGEPVTFFTRQRDDTVESAPSIDNITSSMAYLDSYILSAISKGKLSRGGGDDHGLVAQAAHSSAIGISELIHAAHDWCYRAQPMGEKADICSDAPMLVASLLSPLLASVGVAYLRALDEEYLSRAFLSKNRGYSKLIPLMDMGLGAIKMLDDSSWKDYDAVSQSIDLFPREIMHLYALKYLMRDDFRTALVVYTKLLEQCPGDALALSLIMDVAKMVGYPEVALRAAAAASSYWQERSRRSITGQTAISGPSLGSSLIAVGMAMGGRYKEAEMLAETSLKSDRDGCSGLAAWALSMSYHAEGRVSEGFSLLSGFDGTQQYEDCGFLFFNSKLGGNGAQFILDRDAAHADRAALRLYDNHFDRILQYSGYYDSTSGPVFRMKPESRRKQLAKNLWGNLLTSLSSRVDSVDQESESLPKPKLTVEDVFTWLPPTHTVLTQATLLLFRLTISGIVPYDDTRWRDIKESWLKERRIQDKYRLNNIIYEFAPSTRIIACVVLDGIHLDSNLPCTISSKMEKVSHLIGCAMKFKESSNIDNGLIQENERWMEICDILSDIRTGYDRQSGTILIQDNDLRDTYLQSFWEYAVFYAATKTKTHDALCMARSVCSEGVTLRSNSPETWLRYSVILDELGDSVAAEEARQAAVSLGSGEGSRFGGE